MHQAAEAELPLASTPSSPIQTYAGLLPEQRRAVDQTISQAANDPVAVALASQPDVSEDRLTTRPIDPTRWSEQARLKLHFVLLKELQKLRYQDTPLSEYVHLIEWVSSDKEDVPFSFHRCILVAKLFPSLCADDEFEGLQGLDVTQAAEMIRVALRPHIRRKLSSLPFWAQNFVRNNWQHVVSRLEVNDQWLNEAIKLFPFMRPQDQRDITYLAAVAQPSVAVVVDRALRLARRLRKFVPDAAKFQLEGQQASKRRSSARKAPPPRPVQSAPNLEIHPSLI